MNEVGPSASKLKLSRSVSEKLQFLSQRLGLRRNIVCRLAIGKSLAIDSSVALLEPEDDQGMEFNRYTLTGEFDDIYKALVIQHEGTRLNDRTYISVFLRNHIEKGVAALYNEYQTVNSPIEFIVRLAQGV